MKLLFDQNLSPQLAPDLDDVFPGSAHVEPLGLGTAKDGEVWEFAKANGFAIVSKDEDFHLLSVALSTKSDLAVARQLHDASR